MLNVVKLLKQSRLLPWTILTWIILSWGILIFSVPQALAGGPRFVAGPSYFNPAVMGQPIHWAQGQVNYFVDQGSLSPTLNQQKAKAMVDAAAALWTGVPTAAVILTNAGSLGEDVNGLTIAVEEGVIIQPADITATAVQTPLAVVFDVDGTVIETIFGTGASDPANCGADGVFQWTDGFNPDATFAHAMILLNGRCAVTADQIALMSANLERAFGRALGLDYAQVYASGSGSTGNNWAVMQPPMGVIAPGLTALNYDDIAALSRLYPVTSANQAGLPGKVLTAANTVSIQGTINFVLGVGMQGVNVIARPLDGHGNEMNQYGVSFVSGAYFSGNHGNPVTGLGDTNSYPLSNYGSSNYSSSNYGSSDPRMQGYFDLSCIPLPPGMTSASYQVSFEPVDPDSMLTKSVGPYVAGSPLPSGSMPTVVVPAIAAGGSQTLTQTIGDSASGGYPNAIGSPTSPRMLPPSGLWVGQIGQVGQTDWFEFPVQAGRTFTVVAQPMNETGAATTRKMLPAIGIWNAFDAADSAPVGMVGGPDGISPGETWVQMIVNGDDIVRLGIADSRGDGRPDYNYQGWVLYAATVTPTHLPSSGGAIVISGMGFHPSDTVLVGGQPARVTSISTNQITAIAPPAAAGVTGSVDVEVDDQPIFSASAVISGGVRYDAGDGDALKLETAPQNTVPIGVPLPFTVTALQSDLTPASGVTVTYTVSSGTAVLACGQSVCSTTATGDGRATLNVTAIDSTWSIVIASLTNGSIVQAQFGGGAPPTLTALTPPLHVAAGVTITWTTQALVLNNGVPAAGQTVAWQPGSGTRALNTPTATTGGNGQATRTLTVGPIAEGASSTTKACLNGTSQCTSFVAFGSRAEFAYIEAVSGVVQTLSMADTAAQVTLRLLDMNGNEMAGGTVTLYESLYAWAPPCGRHHICPPAHLLATQIATATSALDGTVTFTAASIPGVATNLIASAVTGNTASIAIAVEQHP